MTKVGTPDINAAPLLCEGFFFAQTSSDERDDMSEQTNDTPFRYTAAMAQQIETSWQDRWEEDGTFNAPNPAGPWAEPEKVAARGEKLIVLDMFPYPSGVGLHVGHPLGYIATDVYSRFHRMLGKNVLHALGYDAFGLPAEQFAVQTGQHPRKTTEENMTNMKRQLRRLGLGFDNRRTFATIDDDYYRWTQWIFLQIWDAWYDAEAVREDGGRGRARPISELVEEFESGRRAVLDAEGRGWADLSATERATVLEGHRLAYTSEAPVNWCPGLGTVLSNEEVTNEGRSERGNFPVFRRNLSQWKMRITAYADRLADDLDGVDWPEKVKLMQRNWIGRSKGARVTFPVITGTGEQDGIDVFTTRPDTIFGATFMVIAPEHPLVDSLVPQGSWPEGTKDAWKGSDADASATPKEAVAAYQLAASRKGDVERQTEGKDKTGVFTGSWATNPLTGERIPVFVADYVLMGYGTGAIMAVPGQDTRDWEFAEKFDIPIVRTVQPTEGHPDDEPFLGDGVAINSANERISLDGLHVADAKARIIDFLEAEGLGEGTISYRIRDWLFSRQRYWGEPFPIMFDEDGVAYAVPDDELPLTLPDVPDYSPKTFDPDDAQSSPEPPLIARARVGRGREGPRRRPRAAEVPPRDEHDAQLGRLVLVLPALPRPGEPRRLRRPGQRGVLAGPSRHPGRGRPGRHARPGRRRPLRRRRRARGPAPALRALLAQGPLRPRPRQQRGALPEVLLAGLHPGVRLHRQPWSVRHRVRGRGAPGRPRRGADLHVAGPAGQPGVRQDRQVAEELREPGRDVRRVRRRHLPRLRDVDGSRSS